MQIDDDSNQSVPGKMAPLLLADILVYNPTLHGFNSLTKFPEKYIHSSKPPRNIPIPSDHVHALGIKEEQSVLLPFNVKQDRGERCNVAAICSVCRLHFDVSLAYPEEREPRLSQWLCGPENTEYLLHHFQYLHDHSQPLASVEPGSTDTRIFLCSAPCCFATLTITTRLPLISPTEVSVLKSERRLQERRKEAILFDPTWDSDPARTPLEVFETLFSYLRNAKDGSRRGIPRYNRRVMQCFGYDHEEIFKRAHFKFVLGTDEADQGCWMPPEYEDNRLTDPRWQDLNDMFHEAQCLLLNYKKMPDVFKPAEQALRRLLVAQNFEVFKNGHRKFTPSELTRRTPYYGSLGAMDTFEDKLIIFAYECQKNRDSNNAPYYLECLANIAEERRSEDLQMALAQARSRGEFSTGDVRQAYYSLHLDPDRLYEAEDILGKFRSFIADAPRQEAQMRQNLQMIGVHLHSQVLVQASQKVIVDIKQAYQFLGAEEHIDDHFILSLYQIKIKDNPEETSIAQDALRLIAETRMSSILKSFLETGNVYEQPLDVGIAYSRLDIPDRTLSDEMVIEIYNIRVMDGAVNLTDLREALRAIGEDRDSDAIKIRAYLRTGEIGHMGKQDWPVGLENIGNTCYLNSLLQYYFTIAPLREMILQFDIYQEDLTEDVLKMKRVGGRKLTTKEVERAQKFVSHLRTLFQNMISSREASVTPEHDLAYLALVSSKDEAEENVRDIATVGLPPLITIDKSRPEDDMTLQMDIDTDMGSGSAEVVDDNASEITLVEKVDIQQQDGDFVMVNDGYEIKVQGPAEDKENQPPKSVSFMVNAERPILQDVDMNGGDQAMDYDSIDSIPDLIGPTLTPPQEMSDVPPPIPPRPRNTPKEPDTSLMFGRQQDVAECIENVMFQIEAAVKGTAFDENGEQIDLVKTLFYGKTKQSLQVIGSSESRHKTELFSHLLIDVAEGNRDIYSALDSVFDVTTVNLEGKDTVRYLSISHLPPILQIQVQRVQFDRANGRAYKSTSHLAFPEIIYMDRYLDSEDAELQMRRQEAWEWKTEISALERRKLELTNTPADIEMPVALDSLREWIVEISQAEDQDLIDPDLLPGIINGLEGSGTAAATDLHSINERLQFLQTLMSAQFSGLCQHGYRIHSVFIHRGSASFGHYWIYIYDFKEAIWRKYNDGYVTKVDNINEVFNQDDVNPATPYFLVFVREDQTDIMEAVHRQIEEVGN